MTSTIEQRDEIRRLNAMNMPKTHIAKKVGVSVKTVYNVLGREDVGTIVETRTLQPIIMVNPMKQEKSFHDRLIDYQYTKSFIKSDSEFTQIIEDNIKENNHQIKKLKFNQLLLTLKIQNLNSITNNLFLLTYLSINQLRSEINLLPQISQLQVDIKAQELKYKLTLKDINIL